MLEALLTPTVVENCSSQGVLQMVMGSKSQAYLMWLRAALSY